VSRSTVDEGIVTGTLRVAENTGEDPADVSLVGVVDAAVSLHQLFAPIALQTMLRPGLGTVAQIDVGELSDCTVMFAGAFVRAVSVEPISAKATRKGKRP